MHRGVSSKAISCISHIVCLCTSSLSTLKKIYIVRAKEANTWKQMYDRTICAHLMSTWGVSRGTVVLARVLSRDSLKYCCRRAASHTWTLIQLINRQCAEIAREEREKIERTERRRLREARGKEEWLSFLEHGSARDYHFRRNESGECCWRLSDAGGKDVIIGARAPQLIR